MQRSAVIYHLYDYSTMWAIVSSLEKKLASQGHSVTVVDLTNLVFPRSRSFQSRFRDLQGKDGVIREFLAESTNLVTPRSITASEELRSQSVGDLQADFLSSFVASQVLSYLSLPANRQDSLVARYFKRKILQSAHEIYLWAKTNRFHETFTDAFIPNGRMPAEASLAHLHESASRQVHYFEASFIHEKFYLAPFPPANLRAASESRFWEEVGSTGMAMTAHQAFGRAKRQNANVNKFAKSHSKTSPRYEESHLLTFFSSSSDEFQALPSDWGYETSWSNQYDAFSAFLNRRFQFAQGLQPVLRIHPNVLNKSLSTVVAEIKAIYSLVKAHPNIDFFGPESGVDSYSLVNQSKLVVVALSTIGLEAMLQDVPVVLIQESFYSSECKAPVFAAADQDLELIRHPSILAERFVEARSEQLPDLTVSRESAHSWDPKIPFSSVRLSWLPSHFAHPGFIVGWLRFLRKQVARLLFFLLAIKLRNVTHV